MRINIILLLVAMIVGSGLTFWLDSMTSPPHTNNSPSIISEEIQGEKFPDFVFTDIKGKKHNSHDYQGKTVVLNFWATWCAPCVIEFPKLMKLAADNPAIIVIALSSDINDEKIRQFLKKHPITQNNFIVARDNKRKITADIFKTYKLPETLIVSPSGLIAKKIVGDTDWNGQDIRALLNSLEEK